MISNACTSDVFSLSFFVVISMSSISASGARGSVDLNVSFVAAATHHKHAYRDGQTDRLTDTYTEKYSIVAFTVISGRSPLTN